jgi:type IV fimbrial biogenesis protein FimT
MIMKTQTGFTLIELMVTVAIAMILTMWAVPNMRSALLNNRITAKTNEFIRTIHYVKNETITRNNNGLIIQPFDDKTWESGWKIVDSDNKNIKVFPSKENDIVITEVCGQNNIIFFSRGWTRNQYNFIVSHNQHSSGRIVSIARTGRVKSERCFVNSGECNVPCNNS